MSVGLRESKSSSVQSSDPFAPKWAQPFGVAVENPFAPPRAEHRPSAINYAEMEHDPLVDLARAPSLPLDELALEVRVSWGASVLAVEVLTPPRAFALVASASKVETKGGSGASFAIFDASILGREVVELVSVEGGHVSVHTPNGARAFGREGTTRFSVGSLDVTLCLGRKPARLPIAWFGQDTTTQLGYLALSLASFGSMFGALAYFVPPLGLEDEGSISREHKLLLSQYLNASAEREREIERTDDAAASQEAGGESGRRAPGQEGAVGKPDSPRTKGRLAISGGPPNTPRRMSRQEMIDSAKTFGMIGMLESMNASDRALVQNAFSRDASLGPDSLDAHGNLWDADIAESIGGGGLAVSGPGFGGGDLFGMSGSIGIGNGTIGGLGTCLPPAKCSGGDGGFGGTAHLSKGRHTPKSPSIRPAGETIVSGRIPPEVIQRTIRQNFGRFRMCYERGLAKNPNLEGRVAVRFVIDRQGAVASASASDGIGDPSVTKCVESAFYGLGFAAPEGGIVTVTYPLLFTPG